MTATDTDRLDALFDRFPVHARVFHSGTLCGATDFSARQGVEGQFHLIRAGTVHVLHEGLPRQQMTGPCLLLYPRPKARRFITDVASGADLVCANLSFVGGLSNPIAAALPDVICLPLSAIQGAAGVLDLLFDEAFGKACGRRAVIDRLFEVVLIQLLRHLMETQEIQGGMLAGLSDARLRRVLVMMHEQPAHQWSLEALASVAGMSRSVFANRFRDTVGCTPWNYLQGWRVRLAQLALLEGQPLKMVAMEVGYTSEAALSRAFKAQVGMAPREWRKVHQKG